VIQVYIESGYPEAEKIKMMAVKFGWPLLNDLESSQNSYVLCFYPHGTVLRGIINSKSVELSVDFVTGKEAHRRRFGGGKSQAIAKAVGLNKRKSISVLDATAGLGSDAFVLASLGCSVTLLERSPVVRLLLEDGLKRAMNFAEQEDAELLAIMSRMQLLVGDSYDWLNKQEKAAYNVIYLDPMFPARKKSAEVKKEMQFFHSIVGCDQDADKLLLSALNIAENRVVVKRPRIAPFLASREPHYQLVGKSNRFDIYSLKSLI